MTEPFEKKKEKKTIPVTVFNTAFQPETSSTDEV